MTKTILLTGATDGIGLEAAKLLAQDGHHLLIHGRNPDKLEKVKAQLESLEGATQIDTICADLSRLAQVPDMAAKIIASGVKIDVLINNAGVFKMSEARTADGFDARFAVNLFAPVLLTEALLPITNHQARVVNLSSAAQAPVDIAGLEGHIPLADSPAYAMSKLALTIWTQERGQQLSASDGPMMVAVNPASLLASNMVKEAYGIQGNDLSIGADILYRAALSDEFANAHGRYYDNDNQCFAAPHEWAGDAVNCQAVMQAIDRIVTARQLGSD